MARTLTLEKTYAQMQALIASNGLDTQTFYKITDRGDNGLLFRAAATNRLENDGIRYMLCPATYATGADAYSNDWIGVWNATKQATVTEGQLTIWNGLVWVAGAVLSGDAPDVEASGWTVIPKASFTNNEYVEMVFNVSYDFDEDWINKQWDENDNHLGCPSPIWESEWGDISFNPVDVSDWNFSTSGFNMYGNHCHAIWNNSNHGDIAKNINCSYITNNYNNGAISNNKDCYIWENSNDGQIDDNKCQAIESNTNIGGILRNICESITENSNGAGIYFNNVTGTIVGNSCLNVISNNSNNGNISNNSNSGVISNNSNNGDISNNSSLPETTVNITKNTNNGAITGSWDADVTDAVVDKTGTANSSPLEPF